MIIQLHLASRLKRSGTVPLFPPHAFMRCTGTNLFSTHRRKGSLNSEKFGRSRIVSYQSMFYFLLPHETKEVTMHAAHNG
jgi:hypothetical protein